jgi:hypothetical protein
VGGGVGIGDVAVPTPADDASVANDDCADRDLAGFERALGGAEGFFHPEFIGAGGRGVRFCFRFQCGFWCRENCKSVFTMETLRHGEGKGKYMERSKTLLLSSLFPSCVIEAFYWLLPG